MKKLFLLFGIITSLTFLPGCVDHFSLIEFNNKPKMSAQKQKSDKQKIEQLEKNDNYIPWWKK